MTGERDSEYFNREPEEDFDLGDADATDNSDEEANAKQLEDATKIEQPKPVAAKPKKDDAAATMSLEEWRKGLLGHPETPVTKDGDTVKISEPANNEGADLIMKVFSTFMPRINSYEDSKECITALNGFYKTNKKAVMALRELDPKHEEAVLGYFKAAKVAASNNEVWNLEE